MHPQAALIVSARKNIISLCIMPILVDVPCGQFNYAENMDCPSPYHVRVS